MSAAGADAARELSRAADASTADGWQRFAPAWIRAEGTAWALLSPVLALPAGAALAWWIGFSVTGLLAGVASASAAALLVVFAGRTWTRARYARASFRLFADRLALRDGVLWRREIHVPCSRVQHVDVTRGPLARRHGLATLVVHTAGSAHSRVVFDGLPLDVARALRDRLVAERADDGV